MYTILSSRELLSNFCAQAKLNIFGSSKKGQQISWVPVLDVIIIIINLLIPQEAAEGV